MTRRNLLIYVAGAYRGPDLFEIAENIRDAERMALQLWTIGFSVVCPHTNIPLHFTDALPNEEWLKGCLRQVEGSDAVFMLQDWHYSEGARTERQVAIASKIPVFEHLDDLCKWADDKIKKCA